MLSHTTQLLYPLCHTFSHTPTHKHTHCCCSLIKRITKRPLTLPLYIYSQQSAVSLMRASYHHPTPSCSSTPRSSTSSTLILISSSPTHTHTCHTVPLYHPSVHSPIEVAGTRAMQLRWALCERGCRLLLHCASKDLSGRLRDRTVR